MHLTRRLLRRIAREEDGIALVLALVTMSVLAVTTSALLLNGAVNQSSSAHSLQEKRAFQLAQTGLAYAEGMVYSAGANNGTVDLNTIYDIPTPPGGGSGDYYVDYDSGSRTWTMHGSGTFGAVTKTVSAQANQPSPVTQVNSGVWNYVYSDASGSSCATNLNGSVTISVPILVRGDLCLGGSLAYRGAQIEAGGNLSVTGSAKIGLSTAKVSKIRVGLTSSSTNTCNSVTPGTGACDGAHSPIWATSVAKGMDVTPSMPCIGQPTTYNGSSLNPACSSDNGTWSTLHTEYNAQLALTKNNCPTNLLDNNGTLDNSDTSISSVLFRSTAYDCTFGSNEISWTPSTHTLHVSGTIFFDGSITLSGTVLYTGQATLYVTGGVNTSGSPVFCGASSVFGGQNCTTAWNPDTDGIIFVAGCWSNSTGSTLSTSSCVSLGGGANVQFGVYCTTQYTTAGGSSNMGPVLANALNLGGGAQTLMPFDVFPPNTPQNTSSINFPADPPSHWSG